MRAFVEDEAVAYRAMLLEPDETAYLAVLERARSHLHNVSLGFGRAPGGGPVASDDAERAYAEKVAPRPLFAVARHERGGRPVYRAYAGDDSARSRYTMAFNLADVEGALKIVGRTLADAFAPPGELVFEPLDGDQLDGAGPALEAARIMRPTHEPSAAHYDGLPT
jgi:hypothetical protein